MNPQTSYARYSDSVETLLPDEEAVVEQILASFDRLRRLVYEKHRHAHRGAHAKSHGILRGELTVAPDLPEELAQGMFREAGTYPVIARFSTAPGDILPDGVSAFRGLALKIIGVRGEKFLPQERDAVTQDFLFFNHPSFATADINGYLREQLVFEKAAHLPEEVQQATSTAARGANAIAQTVTGGEGELKPDIIGTTKRETHPLGETYFTGAPSRFGDYVAKISVVPASYSLRPITGAIVDTREPGALKDAIESFCRVHAIEYDLSVQLCTSLETMPVEDFSVRWSEDESPYRVVARLSFAVQEAYGPARRTYADDTLSFTPWHCLPEHRPLGSLQRVRRTAYDTSSQYRHDMNARPRTEPRTIDELPD